MNILLLSPNITVNVEIDNPSWVVFPVTGGGRLLYSTSPTLGPSLFD